MDRMPPRFLHLDRVSPFHTLPASFPVRTMAQITVGNLTKLFRVWERRPRLTARPKSSDLTVSFGTVSVTLHSDAAFRVLFHGFR